MDLEKGSALIFVLWIIAILSIIASEIAFNSRINSELTYNFSEKIKNYPSILSCLYNGIGIAQSELLSNGTILTGKTYSITLKDINYQCNISFEDEGGKYNLNKVTEKQLINILDSLNITGQKKDIIVDSILDWRDKDDFHRLNGAENDYYESLDPPYKCKNGDFSSISELMLVRGIDHEIYEKLSSIFNIYGNNPCPEGCDETALRHLHTQ